MSGIIRSSRITSTSFSRTSLRHCAPEFASIGTKPSRCTWRTRIEAVSGSSSTTIMWAGRSGWSMLLLHKASSFVFVVQTTGSDHAAAPELGGKRGPLEAQQPRCGLLVAAGLLQRLVDQSSFQIAHQILQVDPALGQTHGNLDYRRAGLGNQAGRQNCRVDDGILAQDRQPLDHILQFPNVTGPVVGP